MIDIGRLCVKIAGRDAGRECVIIEKIDDNFVRIDGNTRRRKCNIKHLQLLPKVLKIKNKATHEEVAEAMKNEGIKVPLLKKAAAEKKTSKTSAKKLRKNQSLEKNKEKKDKKKK